MSLSEIQDLVSRFTLEKDLNSDVTVRILDLASEVGELSKEVLKGSDYGTKPFQRTKEWYSELGDVLFSLICIANVSNTNLEECLCDAMAKYDKRFADTGDIGSAYLTCKQ